MRRVRLTLPSFFASSSFCASSGRSTSITTVDFGAFTTSYVPAWHSSSSIVDGKPVYLGNPAGVVFGPTASLSVGGSVHVSTADYLRFSDGAKVFSNVSPNPSVLTAASPAAFGFLGPTPAGITITQNQPAGTLLVGSSSNPQTLSLIGGPIQINGSILLVQHGRIQIASVASAGEVIPSAAGQPPALDVGSFSQLGEINLSNRANPTVSSSSGGGTILIRGGKLVMTDSKITADSNGTASVFECYVPANARMPTPHSHGLTFEPILESLTIDGTTGKGRSKSESSNHQN